ncbi:MAG: FG-GAP repeat domain-containing protein [Bacteroidales bacterium]
MVENIAESENKKLKNYIKETRIDKETQYKIYKFPAKNVFENFFGFLFSETNFNYCTFVDNYLIFSSSEDALLKFIHANILKKTLEYDVKFSQFTEFLSSKSNFYFYCNMLRSTELIASVLNDTLKNGFKTHKESFKKFQALALQFSRTNNMIYNNLFLKYIPDTRAEAITIWESRLDTVIDFKPTLVTNHYSKENEIFVQDLNHKIYLINKVGRILWQIQLNEKINSEIYQVDYYKNGKLQLLFSTQSQIHLIDRNGNYVERYPIKLRSASTAGISVFDYEKNRDYRLFVPCRNKNIYAYDIQGNLVNGWTFQQSDKIVSTPVQHFAVNTNDYIMFADSYRIYILNRKGEERLRIKNQFIKSDNNQFILETESQKPHVVTTDTSGTIKKIYFDGKVEELTIRKFTPNHYFDYQDLDGDGSKDFIFVDENKLEVYKQNGSLYFEHSFNETIVDPPIYFYFSYDDRKIGIVSKTSNQIYLFNNDGKLYTGFPLKGSTKFTIGFFERGSTSFNLIVGTNYNLLYNYSVN